MNRHWLLPSARPTFFLVLFALAAAAPRAHPQDATTQERLDRLERDLSMLQRQVYRDGVSPGEDAAAEPGSNLAVNTQIRMNRLEQQMRDLTGKVEDEANQVQQLRQRLEQVNSDFEVRLGEPNQPAGPARFTGPPPAVAPPRTRPPGFPAATPDAADLSGGAAPPPGALLPAPGGGTLTPPDATPPVPRNLPSPSASAQYNTAFGLLRQADYPAAEAALRSFVQQHPDSGLAGNAQYWLGESYYARGRYGDAAVAFAEGYKRYPKGPKASETLLKLAMALDRANQKRNSCVALAQLDHDFPHAASAVKQRAAAEKKRLGC